MASIPVIHPTASTAIPSRPYILSLTPHLTASSSHLVVSHPSPDLSIVDASTLQFVDRLTGGHTKDISSVVTSTSSATDDVVQGGFANEGNIWSAGTDARIVRWDQRSRKPGQTVQANLRGKGLPLLSLAIHEPSNLLVAGTELISSESHLLFYDTRSPTQPLYTHSTTHSDDITSLKFLPPTAQYAGPLGQGTTSSLPTPGNLLLSGSTDGLIALTNPKEADEEEAFYGAEPLDGSVAQVGYYRCPLVNPDKKARRATPKINGLKVWGRSDMDSFGTWAMGRGQETGDVEMQDPHLYTNRYFKHLTVSQTAVKSRNASHIVSHDLETAEEEQARKQATSGRVRIDYLINATPTVGINQGTGEPIVAVGSNDGDIVLMHHRQKAQDKSEGNESGEWQPSLFLRPPPSSGGLGHADVVRCLWHDVRSQVLYTGSEDGVLSGWSLPPLESIATGYQPHDTDPGDGREDIESEDEDGMDVDQDDEEDESSSEDDEVLVGRGKRGASEVLGGGKRRRW